MHDESSVFPTRRGGRGDDPDTWGDRREAESRVRRLVNGEGGGIGIELGDLGDGTSLGGIDLDTCRREDGAFEPWAREIIDRFASYTEISPSGTGAKVFYRYETAGLPKIRTEMGGSQDPCGDDLMQPPREDRDLIAAARNNHVLAFDNLSSVSGELADSLCRLATGGDIGGRSLYTNDDSAAFAAQRPVLLNGIPDLASRGDLASRTLFVRLSPMRRRRPESELWEAFNTAAPGLLGALLDVLSAALANLPLAHLPEDSATFRMADFALLAMAAEPALGWPSGTALGALRRNMRDAASMPADLDPVAIVIRKMIDDEPSMRFKGLVSGLYARLNNIAEPEMKRAPGWPKGPPKLGEHLRRIGPSLRSVGIAVSETRTGAGMRITIEAQGDAAQPDGVGRGASLFKSGKEEGDWDTAPAREGGVNSGPHLPHCLHRFSGTADFLGARKGRWMPAV